MHKIRGNKDAGMAHLDERREQVELLMRGDAWGGEGGGYGRSRERGVGWGGSGVGGAAPNASGAHLCRAKGRGGGGSKGPGRVGARTGWGWVGWRCVALRAPMQSDAHQRGQGRGEGWGGWVPVGMVPVHTDAKRAGEEIREVGAG